MCNVAGCTGVKVMACGPRPSFRSLESLDQGAFINHVDMAGGGGLPNVHIST